MASVVPRFVKDAIIDDWRVKDLRIMLMLDTFNPNPALHQFIGQSGVIDHAHPANGPYLATGVPLTSLVRSNDGLNSFLDAADVSIGPGATLSYRYGCVYSWEGSSPSTSPILCIIDFVTNQIVTNGTSTIIWNTLGIIYIS